MTDAAVAILAYRLACATRRPDAYHAAACAMARALSSGGAAPILPQRSARPRLLIDNTTTGARS